MSTVTLTWIMFYVMACSGSLALTVWVVRVGGRRGRTLSLVVWAATIQCAMVALALLTGYGARAGLEVGLILAMYPLPFAAALTVMVVSRDKSAAASSRWQVWLAARRRKVIVRACTLGWGLLVTEVTVLSLAVGGGVGAALRGVGLLGSLWLFDGLARLPRNSRKLKRTFTGRGIYWLVEPVEKRPGPARSQDVVRISLAFCVMLIAIGVAMTYGMQHGPDEWRAVHTVVTDKVGGTMEGLGASGVLAACAALAGIMIGVAGATSCSPAQRRLVSVGCLLPLYLWMGASLWLPGATVVWGVLLSGIMWAALTWHLFMADPAPAAR
jgi:hypothetical protein